MVNLDVVILWLTLCSLMDVDGNSCPANAIRMGNLGSNKEIQPSSLALSLRSK